MTRPASKSSGACEDPWKDHVEHPRYGRRPGFTGLDNHNAHWRYSNERVIKGTGVRAELNRQPLAIIPLKIYCTVEKRCRDCRRPFLFHALEQKYWFEDLQFPLDADCVRCHACRKPIQKGRQLKKNFDQLRTIDAKSRSTEQQLELAELACTLVELEFFHLMRWNFVRQALNCIPESEQDSDRYREVLDRVNQLSCS